MRRLLTLLKISIILSVFAVFPLLSQGIDADIKQKMNEMLGANNVGKEFWFSIPVCYEDESYGYANFIKVFVTSPVRTLVTIEVPGKGYYKSKNTVANDVIEFNLTPIEGQVYTKTGQQPERAEEVYPGAGIHIWADQPLVVYCVVRYHWTSDGFLAIPASSLGKEYILASYSVDPMFGSMGYKLPSTTNITAAYDDTRIRFTMGGNVFSKTAGGLKPGQTVEVNLAKGDVWSVSTKGDASDLSGSKVVANKPVGVVSGTMCNNIPNGNQWCDYTVEMDIPTFTWGLDYHVPKVPKRKYASLIRIFAKEPQTKFYRDGKQIGFLKTAGGIEAEGWLEMRMVGFDVKPRSVVISGDKPIGVTLYNTGVQEDAGFTTNSDPFVMVMTPFQQYQKEITFCTPGIVGSQGFNENYLNVCYEADEFGMMPDEYEFAQVSAGQFVWKKLNVRFPGVDELFSYDVNGKKFAVKTITLPGDGVYKMRAKTKLFAAYSFGYSDYDSYGFPTSAALADLEKPDTIPPDPKWIVECDGSVNGATVKEMPDDPKIRTNLAMIVMHSDESFNYVFQYDPFIPGETRTTNWKLAVVDITKDAKAVITFTDRRGNDTTITINYYAIQIGIEPELKDYGKMKLNSGDVWHDFKVVNYSSSAPAVLTEIKLQRGSERFELDLGTIKFPRTLNPKDTIYFKAKFTPDMLGEFRDSIGVGDTCIFFYDAMVKAKVVEPTIDVTDIDFGTLSMGSSAVTKDFLIKNSSQSELTITGYDKLQKITYFTTPNMPVINTSSPLVVPAGTNTQYRVTFDPSAVGSYIDTILFHNDATRIDSMCIITAKVVQPGLIMTGPNWQRHRIDRAAFPAGPYDILAGESPITLSNDGSEDVTVYDVTVDPTSVNPEYFTDVRSFFSNLKIPMGESKTIDIKYQPKSIGDHQLVLHITADQNSAKRDVQITIKGTGILPRLSTTDYYFGTTIVGDMTNIQRKTVVITCEQYSYDDTVNINDLNIDLPGTISTNTGTFGTEGFRFDKSAIALPYLLKPGESLRFDAEFVAQKTTQATASITTSSAAESDVKSTWTGDGLSQSITATGDGTTICVGSQAVLICTVTNGGSAPVDIGPLSLSPDTVDVVFEDPSLWNQVITLGPNETKQVRILFMPTAVTKKTVQLIIPNETKDSLKTVDINVESVHYDAQTKLIVNKPVINRPWPQIGDTIPCSIVYTKMQGDISMAQVTELAVKLNYNGGIVRLNRNSVVVGSAFNGYQIKDLVIKDKEGEMTLTIYHPQNNIINTSGEMLKFTFDTFLPTSKDNTDKSLLTQDVQSVGNLCIATTSEGDSVKLEPTCVYDMRWIATTGTQYSFSEISPNPVSGNEVKLTFSVGLDGWTEMTVYSANGELVNRPVASNLKSGEYTVNMPTSDLSSGSYFIRINSGPFSQMRDLIIRK